MMIKATLYAISAGAVAIVVSLGMNAHHPAIPTTNTPPLQPIHQVVKPPPQTYAPVTPTPKLPVDGIIHDIVV